MSEISELKSRVASLELRNKRQRLVLLFLPVLLLGLGAAAQEVGVWKGKSVSTESLTIVDSKGEPRIIMGVSKEDGAVLVLTGGTSEANVKTGIKLRVKDSVPVGAFVGKKGTATIGVNEGNNRPFVDLGDEKGKLFWGKGGNAIKD